MPYVLVEDFKGGIDTRRTVITSVPGTSVTLTNAHITRGGEIEKRRAFKLWATLPANTHGLAAGGGRVFVFGDTNITLASTQPSNLTYVRFQHPTYATVDQPMRKVLGWDFFEGKVYASILFNDGKIYHYWDGYSGGATPANRIDDWFEGRTRTWVKIVNGSATSTSGTAATGNVTVTGGTSQLGNNLTYLRINNVDILNAPIAHTGDDTSTASNIVTAINNFTSTPNYTASNEVLPGGPLTSDITITAATKGTASNGLAITAGTEGAFTVADLTGATLSGGVDTAITNVKIDGKSIISNPVTWETSHAYTAEKLAEEINATFTEPEWEASVGNDAQVNIIAKEAGTASDNKVLNVDVTGGLNQGGYVTNGGNTTGGFVVPTNPEGQLSGGFVRAFDNQMHALSDDRWHKSEIGDPADWTALNAGSNAAIRVLSNHSRGAEELVAIAPYFENIAIFGQDVIQIWKSDPTPDNDTRVQILNNTGTISGKSVVEIGDSDVFYLSRSGIRSLRARDSSNSAHVGDIGNPIDTLILDAITTDIDSAKAAVGIVDPRDGRYLLAMGAKVYVFSYFPSSKISAWSVYEHGFTDANGDVEPITDWAFDGTELLCRAGDKIYSLGGKLNNEYDSSTVTVQLPFLDAGKPATNKMWTGLDAVCSSDWTISTGTDPTDITQYETAATINKATYGMGRVSLSSTSTHIALRLVNATDGAATLGNCAVHYELNEPG